MSAPGAARRGVGTTSPDLDAVPVRLVAEPDTPRGAASPAGFPAVDGAPPADGLGPDGALPVDAALPDDALPYVALPDGPVLPVNPALPGDVALPDDALTADPALPVDGVVPPQAALPDDVVLPDADATAPAGRPGRPGRRNDDGEALALFAELATLEPGSARRSVVRDQLVTMHLPLVRHLARRFANRGEPLEDLVQVATVGLINSVDRFDPERGADFLSYAVPTVVGEIKRHFRDHGWAVRVPRRLKELHLALTAATAELSQRNGRAPNATELAAYLDVSREDVLEGLEAASAYRSSSLDDPVRGDGEMPSLAETIGDEDAALEHVEFREALQPLLAQVPVRERKILILRFFGNMTQSQIAERMGISQMHVSRLLSQTLTKLRESLLVDE